MRKDEVTPAIKARMSPEDHAKAFPEEVKAVKKAERRVRRLEKAEHDTYLNWGNLNQLLIRHDRMDKRTTGPRGWPDFELIHGGRILPLEFKVGSNKPSDFQDAMHRRFERSGTDVLVCYSADEAIRKSRGWLWEHFRWESKYD